MEFTFTIISMTPELGSTIKHNFDECKSNQQGMATHYLFYPSHPKADDHIVSLYKLKKRFKNRFFSLPASQIYLMMAFNSPFKYLVAIASSEIGLILDACPAEPKASYRALQISFMAIVESARNLRGSKFFGFFAK